MGLSRDDRIDIVVMPGKLGLVHMTEVQRLWYTMLNAMWYTLQHASVKAFQHMSSEDEDRVNDRASTWCEHEGGPHNRHLPRKVSVAKLSEYRILLSTDRTIIP